MATGSDGVESDDDEEDLRARIELLAAENRALRDAHARVRQTRYRRSALGLAALGAAAALAAAAFPGARSVLFALAATGLFAGVLTYYLAPERFVAASVGRAAYDAHADAVDAMVDELGLADVRTYVPLGSETDPARLFVPQHADYEVPAAGELEPLFVAAGDPGRRGVSLPPTGVPLLRELRRTLSGPLADEPGPLADQLADGVVEAFELADRATPDAGDGRVTVAVAGAAFGDLRRVDHPVVSLLAVGLAVGLERPVAVETAAARDDRADALVTCRWSTAGDDGDG